MASAAGDFRLDDGSGGRSVHVDGNLRKAWKKRIRRLPPVQREAWLKSQSGISALGAQACRQLLGLLEARQSALAAGSASGEWVDAWIYHGELPPGLDFDARGRLVGPAGTVVRQQDGKPARDADGNVRREWPDGRQHAVRLVLSQVTEQWIPPQSLELEDYLARMGVVEAARHKYAPSSSALVFQGVEAARGREREPRTKAVSRTQWRQMKRQIEARGETVE